MANGLPSGTAILGALTQFISIAEAALPSGTVVYFGDQLPAYTSPITLQIAEITGDQQPAELGNNYRREEKFALACTLISYQGGVPDWLGMLTALMPNFILVSQAVANNPTLNGAVRFAQVGNFVIDNDTDANGEAATTLDFSVRCEQRVTSLN